MGSRCNGPASCCWRGSNRASTAARTRDTSDKPPFFNRDGPPLKLHPSAKGDGVGGIKFGPLANRDEDMPDHQVVDYGIQQLNAKQAQPFFLAMLILRYQGTDIRRYKLADPREWRLSASFDF